MAVRAEPGHEIHPYLMRNVAIERPNQVWAMDIMYLPMRRGFVYLCAVMDWARRRILFRLSNTLTADYCVEALEEAIRALRQVRAREHRPGQPVHRRAAGGTTSSSSASGARSSTSRCICGPTRR